MSENDKDVDLIGQEDMNPGEIPDEVSEQEIEEEVVEETSQSSQEDWRMKAMQDPRVRDRFDQALFGNQEQPVYEAPIDPVQQAEEKARELESAPPEIDWNNATGEDVSKFMKWNEDRNSAKQAVLDAKLQRQEQVLQAQRARSTLEDYIVSAKGADPDFKNYEQEFRKFVRENNIDPRLLEQRQVVDMIRKSIGYDHVKARRKAKAPGAPPVDESYNQQGRAARQKKQAEAAENLREPTELDEQLAAFYRMTPEDLIRSERDLGGDAERWSMKGAVQWSDPEKLRKAGFRR